jgi:drug/metabolite transporter (DMT)-like permease
MYDLCKKVSVKNNSVFPTLFLTTFSGWAALTLILLFTGRMGGAVNIAPKYISLLLVKSLIVAASWTATYLALRTLPITSAAPIRASGPFWTLIGAILIFAEIPNVIQGVGMAFVLTGCIFFSLSSGKDKAAGGVKAVLLAFAGTVLGSCSALYDKHLLQGMGILPLTVLWWFLGGMMVMYAVLAAFSHRGFQWRITMPLTGILLTASDAFYFTAIAMPESQISVLSLIRRSSIILTFFIGGALFRERDLRRKALALTAILTGVVLLCL